MKSSASEPGLRLPPKALDITSFKIVEYDQERLQSNSSIRLNLKPGVK